MVLVAFVICAIVLGIDFFVCFKLVTHEYKDRFSSILGVVAFVVAQGFVGLMIKAILDALGK